MPKEKKSAPEPELPDAWKPREYPPTIGACVDLALKLREKRLAQEKKVKALKADEDAATKHILDTFAKSEIEQASGRYGQASLSRSVVPTVDDWEAVFSYIVKTDAWQLVRRQLNTEACREIWEANEKIPGVKQFDVVKVNLHKVGTK